MIDFNLQTSSSIGNHSYLIWRMTEQLCMFQRVQISVRPSLLIQKWFWRGAVIWNTMTSLDKTTFIRYFDWRSRLGLCWITDLNIAKKASNFASNHTGGFLPAEVRVCFEILRISFFFKMVSVETPNQHLTVKNASFDKGKLFHLSKSQGSIQPPPLKQYLYISE